MQIENFFIQRNHFFPIQKNSNLQNYFVMQMYLCCHGNVTYEFIVTIIRH